jgi:glutamate--cysteine ligase
VAGRSVQDVAKDMVHIAREGLKNRARFSGGMVDERGYLSELEDIADSGVTPADRLLALYDGPWEGDVSRIYRDFAY